MTSKSKAKGDGYERELAEHFSEHTGLRVRRTPLSGGGTSDAQMPDLEGLPDLWVEAKRTERFEPRKAMAQALKGKQRRHAPDIAVVINRPNRTPTDESLVFIQLKDFMTLYKAYMKVEGIS